MRSCSNTCSTNSASGAAIVRWPSTGWSPLGVTPEAVTSELGALVDDRKASVDVVEEHVRSQVMPDVLDHVMDSQARLTDNGLDPPAEHELLAKDARLQRLSLGPEHARVSVPALAVAHEASGPVRHSTVETEGLRLLGRVVVLRRGVLCHEQRVVDATRRQQPTTEGAKEAESLGLVVPGPLDADRRLHASETPRSSHRPISNARSTTTSKVNPVPVRNSSTRTPRAPPSPIVSSRTPATWSSRPTRRNNSSGCSSRPKSSGISRPFRERPPPERRSPTRRGLNRTSCSRRRRPASEP